ncbi:hypothetical protein ABIB40_003634 [Pedobacter sp. UYP30]|uniref:M28 family peptidase n=1 Tax=Pedobacter sp. UYP30 TaxID=1756400 RepID=UPI00339AEAFA
MNTRLLTIAAAALFGTSCFAQVKPLPISKNAVKFSKAINPEAAYKHLSVLASDEYEGRETGTRGAWMAADYIRNYFKSIGLKGPINGDYFQKIDLVSDSITEHMFTIDGKPQKAFKDFYIPNGSVGQKGFTFSADEVIFVGYGLQNGDYNDYKDIDVAGKVVMLFANGNPTLKAGEKLDRRQTMMARFKKMSYLNQNKAKAVLIIDPSLDKTSDYIIERQKAGVVSVKKQATETGASNSNPFISISISTATANGILKAAGTSVDSIQHTIAATMQPASKTINIAISASAMKIEKPVRCENVLGYLEGSDPNLKKEVLIITGHYDHIGLVNDPEATDKVNNGADDDGSGTTGVLLMAKAFINAKKAGKGPKRSILFMTVVGEEKGLWGSEWYSEHPVFTVKNTIADLNTDMIGRIGEEYLGKPDSANYIYSIGSNMLSSDLGKLSEQVNATYTKMKLDYKYDDPKDPERIYYRSDHYNFAKLGIPIIFYYDGMLQQDYHQPGDEVSKIHFNLLCKRAKLTYFTAWELANRAKRPTVDLDGKGNPLK